MENDPSVKSGVVQKDSMSRSFGYNHYALEPTQDVLSGVDVTRLRTLRSSNIFDYMNSRNLK